MPIAVLSALLAALVAIETSAAGSSAAIPPELQTAALAHYPQSLLCAIAEGDPYANPGDPITEDGARGWLRARIGAFGSGRQVAVVVYKRYEAGLGLLASSANDSVKVFVLRDSQWSPCVLQGETEWELEAFDGEGTVDADDGVVFFDVDKDGSPEILVYGRSHSGMNRTGHVPESIVVLAVRGDELVALTSLSSRHESVQDETLPECSVPHVIFWPAEGYASDTGVGFLDLDEDGIEELLVYPNLDGARPDDEPRSNVYDQPTTGTKVYRLEQGRYILQYETPIGTRGTPAVAGAIKPASVPVSELESVGKHGGEGTQDGAISLYLVAPEGTAMEDVDWSSTRVADFKNAANADKGISPAAHAPTESSVWIATFHRGQPMLIEQLDKPTAGQLQQNDKDPVIYAGVAGRLHFVTPFRELRFSKKAVFSWLWGRWQEGAANTVLKSCLPEGNHQRCFTPIDLPIKVNLKNGRGFALGAAQLWVETAE